MKSFRKIWNEHTNAFLKSVSGLSRSEGYKLFMNEFPTSRVTFDAFKNQMSRMGYAPHLKHGSTKIRPLYSEQIKKGYVRIKIAQPNTWMMKSRWVYQETHPWEDFNERSNYIFLDGNNRNFDPHNIERVPLYLMGLFAGEGGCVKGHPEYTRLNIIKARLKWVEFNAAEKLGLTVHYGHFRKFRDKYVEEYTRRNEKLKAKRREEKKKWQERK